MSDDEYEYDYGSDAEYDYGSDGDQADECEEGGNDLLIEIENSFYEGDDLRDENPTRAVEMFEKVVELESKGDTVKWRFKALQHLVTLYFKFGAFREMIERYRAMLQFISLVTRNECTEAINLILDSIASATNIQVLSQMYEITLVALKMANNERLWFSTNLKLARLYLEDHKYEDVERMITELKRSCQATDGQEIDVNKSSFLMEIYCLEIQLASLTKDLDRMKRVYPLTLNLNAAVADPRIMGLIREEGGKMKMLEECWEDAYNEFYEAFRHYQEAGNSRARDCLKYVVLASMLSLSDINPFAAREAKVFADDIEVVAMSDLRQSLEANDLNRFEKIVSNTNHRILIEPFIMKYLEPLRKRMREQALLSIVRPYRRCTFYFLAKALNLEECEVQNILIELIQNERLRAQIDSIEQVLIIGRGPYQQDQEYDNQDFVRNKDEQLMQLIEEMISCNNNIVDLRV